MLKKIKLCVLLLTFSLNALSSTEYLQKTDFFVLTVPKSGSFLIMKFLVMLTGQSPAPVMIDFSQLGGYHFPVNEPYYQIFFRRFRELYKS